MTIQLKKIIGWTDQRGLVFEPLASTEFKGLKNVHVVISFPGTVRGNHYHLLGTEIIVVTGSARVCYRIGDVIEHVDIPPDEIYRFTFEPGVAHAVLNTGDRQNVLIAFSTEPHDRDSPDVVHEELIAPS
ncbi:MAG: hypothetical protein HKM93_05345 [Desulfobacteraceae bacterium]|nr:hypothetical protein [Desulfobacteraceae bacterium]